MYRNLSGLNNSRTIHRGELFVSLKMFCKGYAEGDDIHLSTDLDADSENEMNGTNRKIAVKLVINGCSVFMSELQVFQHHGSIWSIFQTNESLIHHDADCSSLSDLQIVASRLPCDGNDSKSDIKTRFFWEMCREPFENVYYLDLEGCVHENYLLDQNALQSTFPKLQTLKLKNVDMTGFAVLFPWTHVYIDTPEARYVSFIANHFESSFKNSSSFPREIAIRDSVLDFKQVNLNGEIASISLNNIHVKYLHDDAFANVSGLTKLDMSYNDLETVTGNVFQTLTKLKHLYLRKNKLRILGSDVFDNIHNLLVLDLSYNNLELLNQRQFKYLVNLEELNVAHNAIRVLPVDFLKDQIHSLRTLKLSNNPLTAVPIYPLYSESLTAIFVQNCRITSVGFQTLIRSLNHNDLNTAQISYSLQRSGSDLQKNIDTTRRAVLDISYNFIRNIELAVEDNSMMIIFQALLTTFSVDLKGNPLDCTCLTYIPTLISNINENSVTDIKWTCTSPSEMNGRLVSSVSETESYCPVSDERCPQRCSCFERKNSRDSIDDNRANRTIIVDCRNVILTHLPEVMPTGKLELWLQNTSLAQIDVHDYLQRTSVFDASHNKITQLSQFAAKALANITSIKLDHNNLTHLPVQLMSTNINKLTLASNPFLCDCHTRWMKAWIDTRTSPVIDWNVIKCSYNKTKVNKMIVVPSSMFVCISTPTVNVSKHIILSAVVIGCTLFVLVSLALLIYFQRFNIKVLLFTHLGVKVCDKQRHVDADMDFDTFVLFSHADHSFVQSNVINGLLSSGYSVCSLYEDLTVGFTFLENIEHFINRSRKIIFSITQDTLMDDFLLTAWNMAYERAINNFTDSIILVVDTEIVNKIDETKLMTYIKAGKYIKRNSKFLQSSVLYLMPKQACGKDTENQDTENEGTEDVSIPMVRNISDPRKENGLVYISYPEELDSEIVEIILCDLQEKGYQVIIFENQFLPGTDIRDEIHDKLDLSEHFIFILSNENLQDYIKMYILSIVISKSALCSHNYLLLFTFETIISSFLSNELENYMDKYVTCSVTNKKFKKRLLQALK
ncbi:protein toll-like [Ruditapes philippinarum]|uniref:protein toll-like n=1 Tax=Ruditapes philippinarum TaxID=129788 RepID=UPI00295B5A55|nr:protein toll-like [Ruditapes philippinarum]